jgi:hypothetical protein
LNPPFAFISILLIFSGLSGLRAQKNIMTVNQLRDSLYEFIKTSYPEIEIEVKEDESGKRHIYFVEEKFKLLFPRQRYHYLIHKIPEDFFKTNLENTLWYELAPNEKPENLDYHDDETIESITDIIMEILTNKTDFVKKLDTEFISEKVVCHGDFRYSKEILTGLGFSDKEQFDIFHVLMNKGGYCDCELLYNVFKESEYAKKYWRERNK